MPLRHATPIRGLLATCLLCALVAPVGAQPKKGGAAHPFAPAPKPAPAPAPPAPPAAEPAPAPAPPPAAEPDAAKEEPEPEGQSMALDRAHVPSSSSAGPTC